MLACGHAGRAGTPAQAAKRLANSPGSALRRCQLVRLILPVGARCTWVAVCQSRGSQVMARVDTLQPSRPVPLWSTSTRTSPGMPGSEMRRLKRKLKMPSSTRTCGRPQSGHAEG